MDRKMHKGYLCLVLHAHLPYVRHPEYDYFLEENWLYEAITETYIPLLNVLSGLADDGVDFAVTLCISPTLIEMLNDSRLRLRYRRHIERLIELSGREAYRTRRDVRFGPVARMYRERFLMVRHVYEDIFGGDLVSAFRQLQDTGKIEIITTAATHAFLPNLSMYPQAIRAQIRIACSLHRKNFGSRTGGMWLPECGFAPGLDLHLREEGIKFFFLDTHGVVHGKPPPPYGVYAPVVCPSGVAAFGRDVDTSLQVWSSVAGYPGDFNYRDFYRDIGFDLDLDHVKSFIRPFGVSKTYTGLKYYRVTGKTEAKEPYVPERAKARAAEHAEHFIRGRETQVKLLSRKLKIRPIISATYDAELFGHWWFEGPEWLNFLLRGIDRVPRNVRAITPSEYLSLKGRKPACLPVCEPSMSSWGDKGYGERWLNEANDYVYRHLHKAVERMTYLADRFPDSAGILQRTLNQAAREVLLSQHSDWTFIMKNGTHSGYAKKRLEEHVGRFNFLYESIIAGEVSEKSLREIEDKDGLFKDIDYRVYRR
jgi:1,4-alpha-glucan branching enzyme